MTSIAIAFLVLSVLVVWGGFTASLIFLTRHPERPDYPDGGVDDLRDGALPPIRDT